MANPLDQQASRVGVFEPHLAGTLQIESALAALGPAAETLANAERLEAHGLSVRARLDRLNAKAGE